VAEDDFVMEVGGMPRAEHGSGPHLLLVAAMVKLARRDLASSSHSVGARAFLRGETFALRPPGIDLDLFAECIGYEGVWDDG